MSTWPRAKGAVWWRLGRLWFQVTRRKVSRRRLPEFIGGGPAMIALLQNIEQR
jgi:hypothetical protein